MAEILYFILWLHIIIRYIIEHEINSKLTVTKLQSAPFNEILTGYGVGR